MKPKRTKIKEKHKHLYKKVSETIEETPNMFQNLCDKDLGTEKTLIIRYKCKCGAEQEFHNRPFEKPNMPKELRIESAKIPMNETRNNSSAKGKCSILLKNGRLTIKNHDFFKNKYKQDQCKKCGFILSLKK